MYFFHIYVLSRQNKSNIMDCTIYYLVITVTFFHLSIQIKNKLKFTVQSLVGSYTEFFSSFNIINYSAFDNNYFSNN